jgi:hypothetical protein
MKSIRTHDLQFAAYIRARGFDVAHVEHEGSRAFVCFDAVPTDIDADFYYRHGTIAARDLFSAYFAIKAIVFSN